MCDATGAAPPRRFGLWPAFLATSLLSSCGSNSSVSPTPTPSPSPPVFVHLLDPGPPFQYYQQVLSTFKADPRTGILSLVDTKAVPNYSWSNPLAADPRGRFVYVNEDAGPSVGDGTFRSYRVDHTSGALTLAGEAPMKGLGLRHVSDLAASTDRLYVGGDLWWGTSHWDNVLGVLAVDANGALTDGRRLIHDWDDRGLFRSLLAVDTGRDLVMAGYRWDYDLHALAVEGSAAGPPGYRDVARLELHESASGPEPPVTSCIADSGRVFFVDEAGDIVSLVLQQAESRFDPRDSVRDGADVGGALALAPDRLAAVTPSPSVPYTYQGRQYSNPTTSLAVYAVGADGSVSPLYRLPESYFGTGTTLAFHPSGRFLFACGITSIGSPLGSEVPVASYVLTFSLVADSMTLSASLPVARCGPMVVTAPGF